MGIREEIETLMSLVDRMWAFGIHKALDYLEKDPDTNIPKLLDWVDWLAPETFLPEQRASLRRIMEEKDGNWYRLIRRIYELDGEVCKQIFHNFIINIGLIDRAGVSPGQKESDGKTPWAALMSGERRDLPYADSDDSGGLNMDFDALDAVIDDRKARGTHIFIFSGDMPEDWQGKLVALCNKHRECTFSLVAEPLQLDAPFAGDILRVKNLIPTLRVTGRMEEWDTLDEVTALLRSRSLPFGFYCRCNGDNVEMVSSDAYLDRVEQCGAFYCGLRGEKTSREGEQALSAAQVQLVKERVDRSKECRAFFPVWHLSADPSEQKRAYSAGVLGHSGADWWQTIGELLHSPEQLAEEG
ncbi:MAG: hypothetical protein LIO58_00845 [Oscillospiraceae bacterium]|nr:hypothetical protein [Oscillospiraceae bacterium]